MGEFVRGLKSACCGWPVRHEPVDLSRTMSADLAPALYRCSHCRQLCGVARRKGKDPKLLEALKGMQVDPRVARLPKWAQSLIYDLMSRARDAEGEDHHDAAEN